MIRANAMAVGPGKSFTVYIGQGDYENDCRCAGILHEIYPSRLVGWRVLADFGQFESFHEERLLETYHRGVHRGWKRCCDLANYVGLADAHPSQHYGADEGWTGYYWGRSGIELRVIIVVVSRLLVHSFDASGLLYCLLTLDTICMYAILVLRCTDWVVIVEIYWSIFLQDCLWVYGRIIQVQHYLRAHPGDCATAWQRTA